MQPRPDGQSLGRLGTNSRVASCDHRHAAAGSVGRQVGDGLRETQAVADAGHRCPICQEVFCEPLRLPRCSHSMCKHCAVEFLNSNAAKNGCPECRSSLDGIDVDAVDAAKWADVQARFPAEVARQQRRLEALTAEPELLCRLSYLFVEFHNMHVNLPDYGFDAGLQDTIKRRIYAAMNEKPGCRLQIFWRSLWASCGDSQRFEWRNEVKSRVPAGR